MPGTTPELGIPFPEEGDEANEGATKIKELAVKVDELLRKQLTKAAELKSLKIKEGLTVEGSITPPTGFALVATGNAYSARVERTASTEYEASATRPAVVIISENGVHPINEVFIGGVSVTPKAGESLSFIVPPKVKWKALTLEEHSYFSSTLIL